MSQAPLTGVRVVDFSHHVAGPYCTKLLAEFGADVIKVERPDGGDPARMMPPFYHDIPDPDGSLLFLHLNTSKRSLALDLKSAAGLQVAKDLVAKADIVVENFSPGTMDRLGLGYDVMRELNPAVVVVSISNFGQTGPYRDFRISEIVAYAMGGSMQSSGHAKKEPLKLAGNSVQYHCGSVAAFGAMAALTGAELTGQGDHIDCSLYETQMGSRDRRAIYLTNYQYTGEPSKRVDTVLSMGGGVRPTSDGYIMIAGGGKRLPNLLRMIGREDLIEARKASATPKELDPAFVEDVEHSLLEWSLARTKAEALAESQKHHIVGGVVNTIADLFTDPHFVERDPWYVIDHPTTGPQTYPGAPFRLSKSEQPTPRPAPRLGEHNREILEELTGAERAVARTK